MNIHIRPLAISELEDERKRGTKAHVSAKDILAFAGGNARLFPVEDFIRRYKEISTDDLDLCAVPEEGEIPNKIIWPLKSAKVCYCLESFVACIAMCGLIGEMMAILIIEAKRHRCGTPDWPGPKEFEDDKQSGRIKTLDTLGLLSKGQMTNLKEIAGIRNRYLHRFSFSHRGVRADAKKAYRAAFRLVSEVLGLKAGGPPPVWQIDPDILDYVKRQPYS